MPPFPSYFDLQVNGCGGVGFTSDTLTLADIRSVADTLRAHGVGGFLPTVITADPRTLRHAFQTLSHARETDADLATMIPGFHLEGPFISPVDGYRGAHPLAWVREPNRYLFDELQECAQGKIRLVTLAPETPGAIALIEYLTGQGVVVALGHTAADGPTVDAAVQAGAKLSTHLGNGCAAMLHRHDNPIWHQLAHDGLWASVIADGHHLPGSVLKAIVRAKGVAKIILTSDAGPLAGMAPGRYQDWGQELEVLSSGKIVVAGTPYLAGGGHFADTGVANLIEQAGLTPDEANQCASENPRRLLGLD